MALVAGRDPMAGRWRWQTIKMSNDLTSLPPLLRVRGRASDNLRRDGKGNAPARCHASHVNCPVTRCSQFKSGVR